MDKKKSNFELLKENELKRNVYTLLLRNIEDFPYLVFSQKKLRDNPNYIDGVLNNTKKNIGRINVIDLPDELRSKEVIIELIKDKLKQLQIEFDSYTIKN